jgi:hypothetical protein
LSQKGSAGCLVLRMNNIITKQAGAAVTLYTGIQEVLVSNLGRDSDFLVFFCGSPESA